jgi:glucosamine--fructose-6-phosphate aminotransferase (isomerizing)
VAKAGSAGHDFDPVVTALERADVAVVLPAGMPEWLAPLVAIVPLQWLALGTAQALGVDVDTPHGLTKVTETR